MACGTPVVTSNTSSFPEVAGEAALLVDPYSVEDISSGIEKMTTDSQFSKQYVQKGLERSKLFSWKETARRTLQVYREIQGAA